MRPGLRTLSTAQGDVTASSLGLRCVTARDIRTGPWRPSQRLPGPVPWTGQAGWGVGWQQSWPQSHLCGPSGPSPGPGHAGHSPTLKPVVLSQHSGATPRGRQERLEPPDAGSLPGQGGVGFSLECLTAPLATFFPNVCFCKNLQPASLVLENICRELNLAPKQVLFSSPHGRRGVPVSLPGLLLLQAPCRSGGSSEFGGLAGECSQGRWRRETSCLLAQRHFWNSARGLDLVQRCTPSGT